MKLWLDLANSPQVLFFRPILAELYRLGHEVVITTRDYAQTVQLTNQMGWSHQQIGKHGGRGLWGLVQQNVLRAFALARWARKHHFDLALSHNSYSQVVAAFVQRIPAVTLMDYEHQPLNHLCFRLAKRVIVPEAFPPDLLKKFGAAHKTVTYPGVKEEVYLSDFQPDPAYRLKEGLPDDKPLVVIRPPAPWTAYHRFENDLFDSLLTYLAQERYHLLFLPRLAGQGQELAQLPGFHIASKVYKGPDLLYHADVVISGGGTMNREAAVLGTPTYTIFKGKMGAVDQYLIKQGQMKQINQESDFARIQVNLRQKSAVFRRNVALIPTITQQILTT